MRVVGTSNATSLMGSFARMTRIDVDRVLMLGNGLYYHDHPIPCRLEMRSKASRETFGIDKGDSMGVVCSASTGGLYLLSSFLAYVQVTEVSAISNNPP